MCAFQGLAGSNKQTVITDRMRRIFGGLPFIQKVNEFYQNHKVILLPAALAVLFSIGALLIFGLW
jgi:predicted transcriptional regulator